MTCDMTPLRMRKPSVPHRKHIFPKNACSWMGLGTLGGNPGSTFIRAAFSANIIAHELGHNFGLDHSRARDCNLTPIDADSECIVSGYGDILDTMGNRNNGHYNAFQKLRLGWLQNVETVSTNGTYILEPYETVPGTNAKALRIFKGIDSTCPPALPASVSQL